MKRLSFTLLIYLACVMLSFCGQSKVVTNKIYNDVIETFKYDFIGNWLKLPIGEAVPLEVLSNSRFWAGQILNKQTNPYIERIIQEQIFWLGTEYSPDKLVTIVVSKQIKISIIETKQEYFIKIDGDYFETNKSKAINTIQKAASSIFSNEAMHCIDENIEDSLTSTPLYDQKEDYSQKNTPVLLSSKPMPLLAGNYRKWNDGVNLLWYQGSLFIFFQKIPEYTLPTYILTGLDWGSESIRLRHKFPIR